MPNPDPKSPKMAGTKPTGSMNEFMRVIDLGPITHAVTFADHFSMIAANLKLRLPPGWFPILRERKDQSKLTATEQERFLCAFSTLNITGAPGQMVQIHGHPQPRHIRRPGQHRREHARYDGAYRLRGIFP